MNESKLCTAPVSRHQTLSRSIGCESDPSDDLGRTVYLWTLIRLVDVWVDEGNECEAAAYEQMVRVCNLGKAPLPQLLRLPPVSASYLGGSGARGGRAATAGGLGAPIGRVAGGRRGEPLPVNVAGLEMDSGSILAPLMEKLMETGHLEEFVEQVRWDVSSLDYSLGEGLRVLIVCCSSWPCGRCRGVTLFLMGAACTALETALAVHRIVSHDTHSTRLSALRMFPALALLAMRATSPVRRPRLSAAAAAAAAAAVCICV